MSALHRGNTPAGRPVSSTSAFTTSSAFDKARPIDPLQPHFGSPSGKAPPSSYPVGVSRGLGDAASSASPYLGASGSDLHPPSISAASNTNASHNHTPGSAGVGQSAQDSFDSGPSNILPRIDLTHAPEPASSCSSPYESPRLPPRSRQGGIGSMGDITLPPLSSAVPMRRGAVSGESSGPSLPFPPMRLPYNDDDIPSRGPSPTLGRRPSFTLGHSRHVPPGPEVQLPTPALAGTPDRRPGMMAPGQANGPLAVEPTRPSAIRLADDGAGYYYANSHNAAIPRSATHRFDGNGDESNTAAVHPSYQQSGVPQHYARPAEDSYYSHSTHAPAPAYGIPTNGGQARFPQAYSRYTYADGTNGGPQVGTMLLGHPQDEHLMAMNGKRPRSAPRVLSSQPRIFACTQCPARFARNHDLKRHQRGHLSVRPYPCTWCGKSFSRKDALKRHVLVKGCGKDRKGNGGGGGGGGGSDDSSRKRSRSGGDDGTERSRSELDGEDDDDDEGSYMKQEISDEEDRDEAAFAQQYQQHLPQRHQRGNYNQAADDHGESSGHTSRGPQPTEVAISRWPGQSPNPFSSIFTGSSIPAGGRLSISGLTGSFGGPGGLSVPAFRPTGAGEGLFADVGFASSRRPSAVAGGA